MLIIAAWSATAGLVSIMRKVEKPFGSGYFGDWIQDEFGLPAYHYTCNQISDPKAITSMNDTWRRKTDHIHQVGNDRFVAVASNYGHVQLRQDEGGPKFLNDFDPDHQQFAGGFGYLTDGRKFLSTYFPGNAESFDRTFGISYYRKTVKGQGYIIDQRVFAPFGDDPLLISQVTVKNGTNRPADLRWIEYWGCQLYQLSYKSTLMSVATKKPSMEYRRKLAKRFEDKITVSEKGHVLLDVKSFKGDDPDDAQTWKLLNQYLSTAGQQLVGGAIEFPAKEVTFEDSSPPPIFLASLDAPFDAYSTNASLFFGKGGTANPDGLQPSLAGSSTPPGAETGLFLERRLHLNPGESKTAYFAYGYLSRGFELRSLLLKYEHGLSDLFSKSCANWKGNRIQLELNDESWVDRELTWHNYYLRSNLTYDSFFKEHILSQGHVYQYIMGFQGAARDPLQHALPFTFSEPEIVKNIIRYTLKTVTPEGRIPYGIVGSGLYMPAPFRPSDLEMWLLWLTSEYVLGTRDLPFLEEEIPTYPVYGLNAGKARIRDLLQLCYKHLVEGTGTGKHGLMRLSNGDWNDAVVVGYVPEKQRDAVTKTGESVLNSAMAAYVLDIYSRLLSYAGNKVLAADSQEKSRAQREAVHSQWTEKWFKRAWLAEELGWVGTDEMWLEPQPWAIIGAAADENQARTLLKNIDESVRRPSRIGAIIISRPIKNMQGAPGTGTNAGIWPSINGTLIWALALLDGKLAWDEWKKNTLALHAETYPDIWYGIWSGPDTYNSEFSKTPGQVDLELLGVKWTDLPVMNMHPHAWPLYSITKLVGIEFSPQGVDLAPSIPKESFKFHSPLIDLEKTSKGYVGKYSPKSAGKWRITLKLDKESLQRISSLEVNGKSEKVTREDGRIIFQGESTPDKPLRWVLKY
jgi:hypothetical protein